MWWQHVIIARPTRKRNTVRGESERVSARKGRLSVYAHLGRGLIRASAVQIAYVADSKSK